MSSTVVVRPLSDRVVRIVLACSLIILSAPMLTAVGLGPQIFPIGPVFGQGDFDAWPVGGSTTLAAGTNSTGDIFVQGSGGFDASVTFTAMVSPSISNSPTITFNPATFGVSSLGSADTFMTISTKSDTLGRSYNYTVTATGG